MSHRITRRRFVTAAAAGATALTLGANVRTAATLYGGGGTEAIPGLDDYCQQSIADWKVPGIALAVVRDGKLLLARGYGVRELGKDSPVDENTIFSIASCTKSFTSAMVGKLVDQNKLRWDDPVSKHVPALSVPPQGRGVESTIRHALQHHTGLPPPICSGEAANSTPKRFSAVCAF